MSRKVSIVVCTYNARDELKECLESLGKEEYAQKEIIVVDDASTDDTPHFLEHFRRHAAMELVVVANQTNLGVAGSRNAGIERATGEIIAFTDADCMVERGWVSELVKGYEHEGVAAVGGSVSDKGITNVWGLLDKGNNFVAASEGYVSYIQGCNMSFESAVLRKYMFNDEIKYGYEETLLCDHLVDDGYRIYYRPQAVVRHRHRRDLPALLRLKYMRGVSSVWYFQKRGRLFMFKRHLALLVALLLLPFALTDTLFLYTCIALFLAFLSSLLRDEIVFRTKSIQDMAVTFPLLVVVELAHFWGSVVGLVRFRLRRRIVK